MRLNHMVIVTQEMGPSIRFFREVMGLPVRGDERYAEVDAGGLTTSLMPEAPVLVAQPPQRVILQVEVEDVAAAAASSRERGAAIRREPACTDWGTKSASVAGPGGLVTELYRWEQGESAGDEPPQVMPTCGVVFSGTPLTRVWQMDYVIHCN